MINKETIEVNGKKYDLHHPGNREWLKLKKEFFTFDGKGQGSIDMETLLDYAFEHVVFPQEGDKLTIDTADIKEIEEVWSVVLPQFLRGELASGYNYKDKRKSGKS